MTVAPNDYPQLTAAPEERGIGLWLRAVVIGAVVVFVAVLAYRLTHALGVKDATPKIPVPTVSVTRVRLSSVPSTVSIIGNIAARYDMPIGVEGDAGRVAAIYVEAGDHVKRGQVLARLNVSVLQPQVANLEAALEQARAEADLADASIDERRRSEPRERCRRRKPSADVPRESPPQPRSKWRPLNWRKRRRGWRAPRCGRRPMASYWPAMSRWGRRQRREARPCFACPKAEKSNCADKSRNRTCPC